MTPSSHAESLSTECKGGFFFFFFFFCDGQGSARREEPGGNVFSYTGQMLCQRLLKRKSR